MRYRTALICSAVTIGLMFGLKAYVFAQADKWQMTAFERALIGVAVFWTVFWWVGCIVIAGAFLTLAVLTSIVRHFRKKSGTSTSTAGVGR